MPPLRGWGFWWGGISTKMPLLTELRDRMIQPQRGCIVQPGVARNELPWDSAREFMNSEGVPSGRLSLVTEFFVQPIQNCFLVVDRCAANL